MSATAGRATRAPDRSAGRVDRSPARSSAAGKSEIGAAANPLWQRLALGDRRSRTGAETGAARGPGAGRRPARVQRLPASPAGEPLQRLCSECEEELAEPVARVQARLTIGEADDPYEREAAAVAERVMRAPAAVGSGAARGPAGGAGPLPVTRLQRMCRECREELEGDVQRKGDSAAGARPAAAPSSVAKTVRSPGSGARLSPRVRGRVEPVLGADLSDVRVHADTRAGEAAAGIRARAFTHRRDIFLGAHQSPEDLALMAHEATHVVQQTGQGSPRERVQRDPDGGGGSAPAAAPRVACDYNETNPIIWFEYDSTRLRSSGGVDSVVHLMAAIRRAQGHIAAAGSGARIYLHGYASEEGDDDYNRDLSLRRANAIKGLLEGAGIDSSNLVARGLGEDNSMGSLPLNRRVEICPTPPITYITMPAETITADAMDCAAPTAAGNLTQYAFLVGCLEAQLASTHGPVDILRTLREIYYGGGRFDRAACGDTESGTVATLERTALPLLTALRDSKVTSGVDVGHVFTGLEGMLCPTTTTSPVWYAPSVGMANEDFLTWGGDIGSAAGGRLAGYNASGIIFKTDPPWSRYFLTPRTLASREDLLGDIDAFSMRANARGVPCSTTKGTRMPSPSTPISSLLLDFYSAPPGMAAGLTSADRYRCFAEAVGAVIVGTTITNIPDLVDRYAPQVDDFGRAFYFAGGKSRLLTWGIDDQLKLTAYSREITELFFNWIDSNL